MAELNIFTAFIFLLSLSISLAFIVPLAGVLIRFRANYNPKGLQLDPDGNATPHTGPVISSYFGMLKRVYRLEGWPGFYKGLMPTLLSSLVISVFLLFALNDSNFRHGMYNPPSTGVLGSLAYSIFAMLVALPTVVITNRAITTPHKLPYFAPMLSLRTLLTPTERTKPYLIYLTPGLLHAQVIHIAYVTLFLRGMRAWLVPQLSHGVMQNGGEWTDGGSEEPLPSIRDVPPLNLVLYIILALFSTAILAPLEVATTRLAIQRNHAAPEFNSVSQEEVGDVEGAGDGLGYSGDGEDVIGLRSDLDPYTSLLDCIRRIRAEEGLSALYRAWWLTALGCLGGAFS